MAKKYNANLIKSKKSYYIRDICEKLEIHKKTVLDWINKEGLEKIGNKKPFLIHGSILKQFLIQKNLKQKLPISDKATDKIFCPRCKTRQKPYGNMVDLCFYSKNRGNLQAICSVCNGKIYKGFGLKDLEKIKKKLDIVKVHNSHLLECENNPLNINLK